MVGGILRLVGGNGTADGNGLEEKDAEGGDEAHEGEPAEGIDVGEDVGLADDGLVNDAEGGGALVPADGRKMQDGL